jgi:hypothetical protein
LQALNDKIIEVKNEVDIKLEAMDSTLTYMNFIWRAIVLGLVVPLVAGLLSLAVKTFIPSLWFAVTDPPARVEQKQTPAAVAPASPAPPPGAPKNP